MTALGSKQASGPDMGHQRLLDEVCTDDFTGAGAGQRTEVKSAGHARRVRSGSVQKVSSKRCSMAALE